MIPKKGMGKIAFSGGRSKGMGGMVAGFCLRQGSPRRCAGQAGATRDDHLSRRPLQKRNDMDRAVGGRPHRSATQISWEPVGCPCSSSGSGCSSSSPFFQVPFERKIWHMSPKGPYLFQFPRGSGKAWRQMACTTI